jgi:hypothetical protein
MQCKLCGTVRPLITAAEDLRRRNKISKWARGNVRELLWSGYV